MVAYVGICHGGVCALAFGNSIIDVPIEIVKITAIIIAIDLFFVVCIFIFLKIIVLSKNRKSPYSTNHHFDSNLYIKYRKLCSTRK